MTEIISFFSLTLAAISIGLTIAVLFFLRVAFKLAYSLKNQIELELGRAKEHVKQSAEINQTLVAKIELLEDAQRGFDFFKAQQPKK
jgi:hypothetical protein